MLLHTAFHNLPPVARRDAEIAALKTTRGQPSFFAKLREAERVRALHDAQGVSAPIWQLNDKASGYRFARSHGVPIPHVHGEYACAGDIPWARLPAEFAVKSIAGTASRGVLPLRRENGGFRDLLSGSAAVMSSEEIVAHFDDLHAQGKSSSELLVEELLRAPRGLSLEVLPDYKLFCFHGVVGLIMVVGRRSRTAGGLRFRYFGAGGDDLGDARPGVPISKDLPAPTHLTELVAAGETLSAAIMSPFVRIDLYDQPDGIVFGEITPAPGGDHVLREDLDVSLGGLWDEASARLEHRAIEAGIRDPAFGPHDHEDLLMADG